ncbi:MAG TPA: cation:proton antiporter subunit C [Syntrophomonadaceae bacterium]|nr:cation:proton antiporter subunit C [Syntrophomonadaceae bacterium]
MKIFLEKLVVNYPFTIAVFLFMIGALIVLTKSNLFKKLIGINVMESAIYIMFAGGGNIRGGAVPILEEATPKSLFINPLPSALMLTGIVVSVSVTAFGLALIIRLYKTYGTTDARKIAEMRNEVIKG